MSKQPASEFDVYHRTYREAVNRSVAFSGLSVEFFARAKIDYLIALIETLRPPAAAAALIDVGCGVGLQHALLSGRIKSIAGIDVSAACIATAAKSNPSATYVAYDGVSIPFADACFDVATALCVLHHVPVAQRVGLMREVRRVLRPGGIAVVFEHNPRNPLTIRAVGGCEFDQDAVLLRREEAESLMAAAGFREIETRFILAVPVAGRLLRAIDRLFSRLPLGAQYYTVARA
ncbi:MAG: class I SAM-dependent methyltransferase [Hyphomicrobiales bacterium]|nr:class I SAM-dependent methyltransferase [Hyphomicrobiales bacterium]